MTGNCHKIVGASTGLITAVAFSGSNTMVACILGAMAGGLGGLVPDIDKKGSKISNKAPITSSFFELTLGHRGILHTPIVGILTSLILFLLLNETLQLKALSIVMALSFMIGYISHIILDTLTPAGTMLLYPISKKRIHFIGINGKIIEIIIEIISLIVVILTIML